MLEASTTTFFVIFIVSLFMSTAVHELCHALAAKYYGDTLAEQMGRISLNPLKHIDPFLTIIFPAVLLLMGTTPILAAKPVPINTLRLRGGDMSMAVIGLVGPASNLLLATLAGLVAKSGLINGFTFDTVILFAKINISLFVFNMIPFPPLDGSRLLYAVAPEPVQKQMENIESVGILPILFIFIFLSPVISPLISDVSTTLYTLLLP